MKIGAKFAIGLGLLAGVSLVVVAMGLYVSGLSSRTIDRVSDYSAPVLKVSTRARSDLLKMLASVQGYLVTGEERYLERFNQEESAFLQGFAKLEVLSVPAGDIPSEDTFINFKNTFDEWRVLTDEIIQIHNSPRMNQPAIRIAHLEVEPLYRAALKELERLLAQMEDFQPLADGQQIEKRIAELRFLFNEMIYSLRGYATVGGKTFKYLYVTSRIKNDSLTSELVKGFSQAKDVPAEFIRFIDVRDEILGLADQIEQWVEGERSQESLYVFRTQAVPRVEAMLIFFDELIAKDEAHLRGDLTHAGAVLAWFEWRVVFVGFAAVVISVSLGVLFHRIMIKPVERLTEGAVRLAEGELDVNVEIQSKDEIGVLAKSFNHMTAQLSETIASLVEHRNDLDQLVEQRTKDLRLSRQLNENSNDAVFVVDPTTAQIVDVNGTACGHLGYDRKALLGMTVLDISDRFADQQSWDDYAELVKESGARVIEGEHRRADGSTYPVEVAINFLQEDGREYFLANARDITERRQLENQLRHSEKMQAIGQLAGGIAHDFNNMLSGITGAAELMAMEMPDSDLVNRLKGIILQSSKRAAGLTEKMLTFARENKSSFESVDVHAIISDSVGLLRNTIDRRIVIESRLASANSKVHGDGGQLQSAILNLCINASHAMPEGGELTIRTNNVDLDESTCRTSHLSVAPGAFIHIEVKDTGSGIGPDVLPRIFEPFYTTKKVGEGTGLGLAAVFGTVQEHAGLIDVESKQNVGTIFHLYLPIERAAEPLEAGDEVMAGEGTVLLVDDEEAIRETSRVLLEGLGYDVLLAENGQQAVEIFRSFRDAIQVVVLDMIMPELNGRQVFTALKEIDPAVRVVLASGFLADADLRAMQQEGLSGFVRKPIGRAELSKSVYSALHK